MQLWEVDILCPVCGAKIRFPRIKRHHKRKHSEYSYEEFEALIVSRAESGEQVFDTSRVVRTAAKAASTDAITKKRKYHKGAVNIFSGGAIGLGKKR